MERHRWMLKIGKYLIEDVTPPDTYPYEHPSPLTGRVRETSNPSPSPGTFDAGILLLAVVLSILSGAAGALLTLYLRPQALPLRISVIDVTKLAQAAKSSGADPVATGFTSRIQYAIGQLQQSDPTRVILIKEAVISNNAEDLTDTLLPIAFAQDPRQSTITSPQASTPPLSPPSIR